MTMISRLKAWHYRRLQERLWPMSRMVERLRGHLGIDGRWLAADPVASALIERYEQMIAPAWFRLPTEDISLLRQRLGLDPHTKPSERFHRNRLDRILARVQEFCEIRRSAHVVLKEIHNGVATVAWRVERDQLVLRDGVHHLAAGDSLNMMIRPSVEGSSIEDLTEVVAQLCEPCPSGTLTVEQVDEIQLDSTRLHWLTEDHHDPLTRARRNEILVRIRVISHSAAVAAIDSAIHEALERKAMAVNPTPSAP